MVIISLCKRLEILFNAAYCKSLLEYCRGEQNFIHRGKIRTFIKECLWRKRFSINILTFTGRKRREQTGLGTLVVYAVKDEG